MMHTAHNAIYPYDTMRSVVLTAGRKRGYFLPRIATPIATTKKIPAMISAFALVNELKLRANSIRDSIG
jgi:hypothetical protein